MILKLELNKKTSFFLSPLTFYCSPDLLDIFQMQDEACAVFSVLLEQGDDPFGEDEDGVTESRDAAIQEAFLYFTPFQCSFADYQFPEHGLFLFNSTSLLCIPNLLMCQVLWGPLFRSRWLKGVWVCRIWGNWSWVGAMPNSTAGNTPGKG